MNSPQSESVLEARRITVEKYKELLKSIQGNILKKHGGNEEALLYLSFEGQPTDVIALLSSLKITSAYQQFLDAESYKKDKKELRTFQGFYLSSVGAEALNIKSIPTSTAFDAGMAQRGKLLNDPGVCDWEPSFHKDIHAILLLADDNREQIDKCITNYKKQWKGNIKVLHVQYGVKRTNDYNQTVEHFDYVDGISQPLFFKSDFIEKRHEKGKVTKVKLPEKYWKADAPLGLVLVEEPGTGSYGSFLVYRKLEQNVRAFKKAEGRLAAYLGLTGDSEETAGAMIIGRFENGLPIVKQGSVLDPEHPDESNDFTFAIDPEGSRCPFHAHIRKSNPRGDSDRFFNISDETERSHRIARRGITYDEIDRDRLKGRSGYEKYPTEGVGLLFLCFQNSIENQFEFVQSHWVDNQHFPRPFTGIDPVIGQGRIHQDSRGRDVEQKWNSSHDQKEVMSLSGFVNMKGGGYFYAPSLKMLQNLK